MINQKQHNTVINEISNPPMDDEIDLRELAAALRRRWRWMAGFSITGLLLGGAVAFTQPSRVELGMVLDLSAGPKVPSQASMDKSDSMGPLLVTTFEPRYKPASANLMVRQAFESIPATKQQRNLFEIGTSKTKGLKSDQLLWVSATVPSSEVVSYRALFDDLKLKTLAAASNDLDAAATPAKKSFVAIWPEQVVPPSPAKPIVFWGLAGCVFGAAAALLTDRRSNRVFSCALIEQQLGFPLLAVLSPLPWQGLAAQAALGQLRELLDPETHWKVMSIAADHPCVEPIAEAIELEAAPPLLEHVLPAFPSTHPGGVLLVVEAGFNSRLALEEARRLLLQLPGLERVALVMIKDGQLPETKS
ncbi:Wzz/FepE/Etk N-terminal domain-containing protein [Synechococcus sp. NB0720_010]|uniref:Wzz/FepE/Etk N-terminal domain-containing protein n=1 Tax=Synechococcus sp. NB0720_010 TaxID=2907159 RepID=UPI001FF90E61|nr:Wzz/FepE/Etk N-terminal domain-containing protein [Synechococcus sp. NB0720_010]UPH89145.1 hypothetical protein LY254_07460 [Synechococcus sp. NB0720_010]